MQIIFYVLYNNSSNCSGPGKNYQPDWECKDCKINNFVKRTKCFRCGKERTEVQVLSIFGGIDLKIVLQ